MKSTKREYKEYTIYACELNNGLVSVEAQRTDCIGLSGQRAIFGGERIFKANGDLEGAIDCFIKNVVENNGGTNNGK